MKLTFSPLAQVDLLDIATYIAQDNPDRALRFVGELEKRCAALGGAPGIGTLRPELGDSVRMLPHGRYLIFYREVAAQLRIERILHGSRDIDADDVGAGEPVAD